MKRLALTALAAWSLLAGPAVASTIPPLELGKGQVACSLGVLDASLDVGVSDNLSLGASAAAYYLVMLGGAGGCARLTWNALSLGDKSQVRLGAILSGGAINAFAASSGSSKYTDLWIQPALNVAWSPIDWFTLRGTWGPMMGIQEATIGSKAVKSTGFKMEFVPNVEVAFGNLATGPQFTLGGNSLLGVRWRL